MQSQPALPQPPEAKPARFKVHHTRSEISIHLGRKVPEAVVDQVMRSISQFEHGAKKVTSLQKDTSLYRLRVGDYRVVLKRLPNGSFCVDTVGHRSIVYDD